MTTTFNSNEFGLLTPSNYSKAAKDISPKELYSLYKALYENDKLYEGISKSAYLNSTWIEALKPIRTVVNRSVEFFVAKTLPGSSVEIITDNDNVKEAIKQILKWSNFDNKKQIFVRDLALYGDLFLKVVNDEDKVYFEEIDPKNVTDLTTDSRGFLTSIRIDVQFYDKDRKFTHTEYWTKEYVAIWVHLGDENTPLEQLGDMKEFITTSELGIDFIPIVHIKFRDTGDIRGKSCIAHTIDKINEANRQATRLSQLLFRYNKPLWVVSANSLDSTGIALPAPLISTKTSSNISQTSDVLKNDNSIIYLPGMTQFNSLIPDINYGDALNVLNAMMDELEQDLPELRYYSIQDSNISGKAIRLLLAGAIDRAESAKNNIVQGLIRVNEIALTIGKFFSILPSNIGTWEARDFDHSLNFDEMFGSSVDEKAASIKTLVDAGVPLKSALLTVGFTEDEATEIMLEKQAEQSSVDNALATSLLKFNQGQ